MSVIKAISAKTVTDSVGVNTHIDFNNFGYQNLGNTITALKYLGVKRIRDCPGNDADIIGARAWTVVAAATGATFMPFIGETDVVSAQQQLDRMVKLAAQNILDAIDGPNEWDDAYPMSRGTTIPIAVQFQQKVFAVGQSLKLPVANISFGSGWTQANNWAGNYDKVGDISATCDWGNAHTYPTITQSPDWSIQRLNGLAKMAAASRPVVHTEYGYNSSQGFAEADMARNDLFAILDATVYGCPRIYFYALFDDGSGLFGLMHQDGTPKLSGTAVRNMLAILASAGPGNGDSLDISFGGATSNDKHLLMQKDDGSFMLALWNESDAPHPVTLTLTAPVPTINVMDPIVGGTTSITQTVTNANSISVSVPTHPVFVQFIVGPPVVSTQIPTAISLNPTTLTLPDNSAPGITVALVSITTDDGKSFGGMLSVNAPFSLVGNIVTLASALPTGPTTLNADVVATENGSSVKATLAVTVVAAPPPLAQIPTGITLTPNTVTIDDKSPAGQVLCTHTVKTSDGKIFSGTVTGDGSMVDVVGGNVVLKGALPPGPAVVTGSVSATGNGVVVTAALAMNLTHGVPVPPAPTLTPNPLWGPPPSLLAKVNQTIKIAGVAVSDQWATGHTGTMALNIDVAHGVVVLFDKSGAPQAGSGTNRMRLALNLEDVNATLMGLQYIAPATVGADSIKLTVFDQSGTSKSITIPITVS